MDKSCNSSSDSTASSSSSAITTTTTNIGDNYLKHLNKLSHKISKPNAKRTFFGHSHDHPPPPPPVPPPQHPQPPVYNISKNEFREVVQKLTGSPAHDRFSAPPPIQPPKPPSSRLQRIRPPPLAHLGSRAPPPLLNSVVPEKSPPMNQDFRIAAAVGANPGADSGFNPMARFVSPASPLPPLPAVNLPAESPVSAYMRCLQRSSSEAGSKPDQFSGFSPSSPLVSPWWSNFALPPSQAQPPLQQIVSAQQGILTPPSTSPQPPLFQLPSSPLPSGCLNSPRSPYPLLSPGLLFAPMSGQLVRCPQFPLSPTPVLSPKHGGL